MNIVHRRLPRLMLLTTALLALTACGGGGGAALIGGTVSGLGNGLSLTLQDNNADNFTIVGNGANSFTFNFATPVGSGDAYSASVYSQPLGQTCTVANGSGNVNGSADAVNSIAITCATTSSVVGTVSGLGTGVAVTLGLFSNGVRQTSLGVSANGPFSFNGVLPAGSAYSVTIITPPLNQTCTLANATGTVVANQSASVAVTCN